MNTQPHPRWNLPALAAPVTPVPIEQSSTRADSEELGLRMQAQSLATKTGRAAPFPSIEQARAILAAAKNPTPTENARVPE